MKGTTYEEKAKWKNSEECVLEYKEITPMLKNGQLVGKNVNDGKTAATKKDMLYNLQEKKKMLELSEKELQKTQEKLRELGSVIKLTPTLKKLDDQMRLLFRRNKQNQLVGQVSLAKAQVDDLRSFIKIREKTLATAPKE